MAWTSHPRKVRLRAIGVLVLLLGTTSAAIVGLRGFHAANLADDPAMAGYYHQETRQAEIMYGSMGVLADDIANGLKRPLTQAVLIAGVSVCVALGCFFFARLAEAEEAQVAPPTQS
jgi:hypothetical protein